LRERVRRIERVRMRPHGTARQEDRDDRRARQSTGLHASESGNGDTDPAARENRMFSNPASRADYI